MGGVAFLFRLFDRSRSWIRTLCNAAAVGHGVLCPRWSMTEKVQGLRMVLKSLLSDLGFCFRHESRRMRWRRQKGLVEKINIARFEIAQSIHRIPWLNYETRCDEGKTCTQGILRACKTNLVPSRGMRS
jgi:hypothetical protein